MSGSCVSIDDFNMATRFTVVCPITSTVIVFPSEVILDDMTEVQGAILTHQEKSLDYKRRNFYFAEKCPDDTVLEVIEKIKLIFEEWYIKWVLWKEAMRDGRS